jgi:hypothetical protein
MPAAPRQRWLTRAPTRPAWRSGAARSARRHFLVRWPPDYQRLVLAEGDSQAVHVGRKGPVGLGGIEVPAAADPDPGPGADDRAWRRWLSDHDLDWDDPDA